MSCSVFFVSLWYILLVKIYHPPRRTQRTRRNHQVCKRQRNAPPSVIHTLRTPYTLNSMNSPRQFEKENDGQPHPLFRPVIQATVENLLPRLWVSETTPTITHNSPSVPEAAKNHAFRKRAGRAFTERTEKTDDLFTSDLSCSDRKTHTSSPVNNNCSTLRPGVLCT